MGFFGLIPLAIIALMIGNPVFALPADLVEETSATISNGPIRSPDGTCGGENAYTCTGTNYGPCCSSYNFVGFILCCCPTVVWIFTWKSPRENQRMGERKYSDCHSKSIKAATANTNSAATSHPTASPPRAASPNSAPAPLPLQS